MLEELRPRIRNAANATIVLAVLAVLYSLYFARSFLIPIAFAILLDFLLSPLVRLLKRARIPSAAGAALVVLTLFATMVVGTYKIATPAQKFLNDAPRSIGKAQELIGKLLVPFEQMTKNAAKVSAVAAAADAGEKPAKVEVVGPSIASQWAGSVQRAVGGILEVLLLLFFLLAGGDLFLEKTIRVIPLLHDKKKAVRIARDIESTVSIYLMANLGLNVVEGIMLWLALWAIGLPNPLLWGCVAVALEFIPYLGAFVMIALLALAALTAFNDVPHVLMVVGAYIVANFIQGNVVSMLVLGRRLALNSVALFVGLAFWFWIWGIPGAFIGVPLMAVIKICCDHIESLAPIGEFLGARAEPALDHSLAAAAES